MKRRNLLFIVLCFACFGIQQGMAQKSIKQSKQQTHFFYTQLNLNGGWMLSDGEGWQFSEVSPYSNLNFTFKSKNQRLLQRGYTEKAQWSAYKASMALVYKSLEQANGQDQISFGLQLRDLWLKINTKWDRTSLKVGHFALPYGHAPKMDIDNSFIPALAGQDFGFTRDWGLLFKSPINPRMDVELALSLGGVIPSTPLNYTFSPAEEGLPASQGFNNASVNYQGNWLASARIGNPTFYKNELGVFTSFGKTARTAALDASTYVFRIGGDWTHKHKETLRISNQLLTGYSSNTLGQQGWNLLQKIELDYFWMRKLVLSFSNSLQFQGYADSEAHDGIALISLSYALSPHARLKVNAYSRYNLNDTNREPGVFVQLVAGIGQRG